MSEQPSLSTKPLAEQTIRDEPTVAKWLIKDAQILIKQGELTQEELDYLLDQPMYEPTDLKGKKIYLRIAQVQDPEATLDQIE